MNNYLLEANDHLVIQKEIERIIKETSYNDAYISTYDLEEVSLSNALEDLDTYSFLSDKKVIVIKNILSSLVTESEKEHLLKYLDNYNPDYLLFITCDKLDAKTFSKSLKQSKNISYKKLEIDEKDFIKNKLKDYKISNSDILYLIDLCKNDLTKIDSECEKLMMYKYDSKKIEKEDITNLVVKKLGDSSDLLFSLVNAIMQQDKKRALSIYQELKDYQVDTNSIIGLMASQMKLISQIKVLKEDRLSNEEIQQELNVKSLYQIKKLSEYIYTYSLEDIHIFFNKLSDLDYKIKSGRIDSKDAIELLIIDL